MMFSRLSFPFSSMHRECAYDLEAKLIFFWLNIIQFVVILKFYYILKDNLPISYIWTFMNKGTSYDL